MKHLKTFESFSINENERSREETIELLSSSSNFEKKDLEIMSGDELNQLWNSLEMDEWLDELDKEETMYESTSGSVDNSNSQAYKSLKKKSEASGIGLTILKQVYKRGMAAWNSGHRPGTPQNAWAMGRVNSFITGSGGARKADSDLWSKAKEQKAKKKK